MSREGFGAEWLESFLRDSPHGSRRQLERSAQRCLGAALLAVRFEGGLLELLQDRSTRRIVALHALRMLPPALYRL